MRGGIFTGMDVHIIHIGPLGLFLRHWLWASAARVDANMCASDVEPLGLFLRRWL